MAPALRRRYDRVAMSPLASRSGKSACARRRPALSILTHRHRKKNTMTLGTILLIVLILILLGALPTWPHSRGWGYYPSGGLGVVVIILLVLVLTNRL